MGRPEESARQRIAFLNQENESYFALSAWFYWLASRWYRAKRRQTPQSPEIRDWRLGLRFARVAALQEYSYGCTRESDCGDFDA